MRNASYIASIVATRQDFPVYVPSVSVPEIIVFVIQDSQRIPASFSLEDRV
jgi:hypothetical protein